MAADCLGGDDERDRDLFVDLTSSRLVPRLGEGDLLLRSFPRSAISRVQVDDIPYIGLAGSLTELPNATLITLPPQFRLSSSLTALSAAGLFIKATNPVKPV